MVSSILPKNKLENSNFCSSLLGQKFFVRFLEELKTPKRPFKINWPLVFQNLCKFLTSEIQVPWNYQVTLYWRAFYPKVPNKVCVRIAVAVGLNLACGRFEKSKERFFFLAAQYWTQTQWGQTIYSFTFESLINPMISLMY